MIADEAGLLVLGGATPGKSMSAIDLATGSTLWSTKDTLGPARLAVVGDTVVELGEGVKVHELRSGTALWSSAAAGPGADRAFPVVSTDGLVVSGTRAVARLGPRGTVLWVTSVSGDPEWMGSVDEILLIYSAAKKNPGHLLAVDLESGAIRWDRALSARQHGPFTVDEHVVAFTTDASLELWDAQSGRTMSSVTLPTQLAADRLPDHVFISDGIAGMFGEQGALAVRASDGAVLYRFSFKGIGDRTFRAALRISGANKLEAPGMRQPVVVNNSSSAEVAIAHAQMMAALSNQQFVNSSTRNDHSRGASMARMAAIERTRAATIAAHRAERTAAQSEIVTAFSDAAMAFSVQIAAAMAKESFETASARRRAAVDLIRRNYQDAIQGRYAVRPIRLRFGDGLLILDLNTGAWAEIPIAPDEGAVAQDIFLDSLLVSVVDGRLVTKGIGFYPEQWKVDEVSVGYTTVHRSLFAYDLSAITLRPPTEYKTASKGRASVDVQWMGN